MRVTYPVAIAAVMLSALSNDPPCLVFENIVNLISAPIFTFPSLLILIVSNHCYLMSFDSIIYQY